jgi:hypothetical protein
MLFKRLCSSFRFQAPSPLLPNYGKGSVIKYSMDIHMLAAANAKERLLEDMVALG